MDLAPETPLERPVPTQRWTLADKQELDNAATMMKLRNRNTTCDPSPERVRVDG